jgi:hypothetical protein
MNDNYEYEYDYNLTTGNAVRDWEIEQASKLIQHQNINPIEKQMLELARSRSNQTSGITLTEVANINNINNIKDNKNIKDLKTINDFTGSDNQQLDCSAPLVSASQKTPQGLALQGEGVSVIAATPAWTNLKIDLFDNEKDTTNITRGKRNLKATIGMIYPKKANENLSAGLNSRWADAKRGFDFDNPLERAHYMLFEETYQLMSSEYTNVRASKLYENVKGQKGQSVFGLSIVIGEMPTEGEYAAVLIDGTQPYAVMLSNLQLTDRQVKNNCIASGQLSNQIPQKRLTRDELHTRGTK